jgi:hypothetical protein
MLTAEPPVQEPPEQYSFAVQTFESSQALFVRHCQLPPALVHMYVAPPQPMVWHRVWVEALQV